MMNPSFLDDSIQQKQYRITIIIVGQIKNEIVSRGAPAADPESHLCGCSSKFRRYMQPIRYPNKLQSSRNQSLQFYQMERLHLRELQKLQQQKKEIRRMQMEVVQNMLQDEYVSTVFSYCHKVLMEPLTQSLSDYSPSHLSKFLFDEQLQKAKSIFEGLPNHECTIEQFLLMMISIMKFPFEKWPFYLVGAKDMFNQILDQKAETISYQNFFKYIIGEVLDFKQEEQNTEFQVRFEELKKQDYLLHDTGVKKFYYSNDTKYYMTLDESSPVIKFYNKEMRMVHKFTANKEKHNKKYPNILHFDYNEMSSRLGIVLSDSTFSIVNLHNYLTKSKYDFELNASNEMVVQFEDKLVQVYYIQMINKWVLINDLNKMFLFDLEKYKQNDPLYLAEVKLETTDLKISLVLELVSLSMVCVVAANEIYFFNESFSEIKHAKFVHGTNIKVLRYCEEMGMFYLCGDEKYITMLTLIKATDSFQIGTFDIQSKYEVGTFDVFPSLGTIVAVDKNHDVRLFDIGQGTCYQLANYYNIVKKQNVEIKMLKISKIEFALYETYTLVFHQEKIAIEKDTQFSFLPHTHYDQAKEEFYVSLNNQIISFSVYQGEIRKSFNLETANVPKHEAFILGKETNLFVLDHDKYIYEAYLKDNANEGENKNYKKKVGVNNVVDMFYDEETSFAFVVGETSIHSIRNDKLNNFSVNSVLNMDVFPEAMAARYNQHQKYLLVLSKNQVWFSIDVETYAVLQYYCLKFPTDPNNHEDIMIEHFDQDEYYNIDIILNNRNEIYLLSRDDRSSQLCLKINDYLPHKLKGLQFINLKYCHIAQPNQNYILLSDKTGYLIEINITRVLAKNFNPTPLPRKQFRHPVKEVHNLEHYGHSKEISLCGARALSFSKNEVVLFKGHDKQIKILEKLNVEGVRTLTISTDGHIKLWQQQQLLFHLKFPDLKKISWNMSSIEKIKHERSVNEVVSVLNRISSVLWVRSSPEALLKKNSKIKSYEENKEVKKFNINEPIQIQIDNKDLEDFIQKTQNMSWYSNHQELKKKQRQSSLTQRTTNYHPWRTKQEFKSIMEKASPENKYKKKMPLDLLNLRNSLDMKDKSGRTAKQYQGQLVILPEINTYLAETRNFSSGQKEETEAEENENEQAFESCLYVKKKKDRKKINEFDEIDKEFKKKWLALTTKKWVARAEGKKRPEKEKSSVGKPKAQEQKKVYYSPMNMVKYDPIKEVKSIFQNYNREASLNKKGRLIRIPEIQLRKQDLFSND